MLKGHGFGSAMMQTKRSVSFLSLFFFSSNFLWVALTASGGLGLHDVFRKRASADTLTAGATPLQRDKKKKSKRNRMRAGSPVANALLG